MKKLILTIISAMLAIAVLAQAPQGISHQAVIRDANNQLVTESPIGIQVSIIQGTPEGTVVYSETHTPTSNVNGLVSFVIGQGALVSGVFDEIDWTDGPYFIKTEADPNGGTNYAITGTSQMLSVPYALHAITAESFQEIDPHFDAWDKSTGISITENQITDLQDYLTEETDPVFNTWDKSTGITITESQITDLQEYLTEEMDGDPTNELQTITQEDYQVTLSHGGGSFITGVKSYTQSEIDALTPYNGLTVHNSTTNCINYYFTNNWFEACGTCTPQPTQADAGDDQSFTDNTITATLAANTPDQGTGQWSIESGIGGSFDDTSIASAIFTGQHCTTYTLAWTITTTCGYSTDNVEVSFYTTPTEAVAGNDTLVGGGATSMNLYANTPLTGEGLWTILSGNGGILYDETDPNTLFTGISDETYLLEWKISTDCDISTDTISVTFTIIQIGIPYQGGIVAYILQPGDPGYVEGEIHGLIAAPTDQGTVQWGCYGTLIGGTSTALGTGAANTAAIVAGCSTAGIAARICNDLEMNGYSDWYLPSRNELNILNINQAAIGGFASDFYWSSSENNANSAWRQSFPHGTQYAHVSKSSNYRVRAVRAF